MEVVLTEPEAEGKSLFIECRIFRAEPACEASTYWAKTELPEVLPMPDFFNASPIDSLIFSERRAVFTSVLPSPARTSLSLSEPKPITVTGMFARRESVKAAVKSPSVSSPSVKTRIFLKFAKFDENERLAARSPLPRLEPAEVIIAGERLFKAMATESRSSV